MRRRHRALRRKRVEVEPVGAPRRLPEPGRGEEALDGRAGVHAPLFATIGLVPAGEAPRVLERGLVRRVRIRVAGLPLAGDGKTTMIHPDTELRFISDEVGYGVFATALIGRGTITWVRGEAAWISAVKTPTPFSASARGLAP